MKLTIFAIGFVSLILSTSCFRLGLENKVAPLKREQKQANNTNNSASNPQPSNPPTANSSQQPSNNNQQPANNNQQPANNNQQPPQQPVIVNSQPVYYTPSFYSYPYYGCWDYWYCNNYPYYYYGGFGYGWDYDYWSYGYDYLYNSYDDMFYSDYAGLYDGYGGDFGGDYGDFGGDFGGDAVGEVDRRTSVAKNLYRKIKQADKKVQKEKAKKELERLKKQVFNDKNFDMKPFLQDHKNEIYSVKWVLRQLKISQIAKLDSVLKNLNEMNAKKQA